MGSRFGCGVAFLCAVLVTMLLAPVALLVALAVVLVVQVALAPERATGSYAERCERYAADAEARAAVGEAVESTHRQYRRDLVPLRQELTVFGRVDLPER